MARIHPESSRHWQEQFRDQGWIRIPAAFDAEAARAMREVAWLALESRGVHRDQPATWKPERPPDLQRIKSDPVFRHVGSPILLSTIDALLDDRQWEKPKDWGALFVAFPGETPWHIPAAGWHIDACYTSPLWPARGVKIFALFGNVCTRGGGTLLMSGSHRMLHRWFQQNPPPVGKNSAGLRKLLLRQPYIGELHSPGDAGERIERYMTRTEVVEGISLQIVEAEGRAGDVYLVHPLVMHAAAPNNAAEPRFMISGGVTTDMWGWASREES